MDEGVSYLSARSGKATEKPQLTTVQKAELIRGVELFSQATVEELFRLAAISRELQFAAKEIVLRENDIGDALYLVVVGKVELMSRAEAFRSIVGPRQAFGLHAFLTREPLGFTATAVEPTLALSIGVEDFYNLLSNDTEIVVSIFKYFVKQAGLTART